MDRCILLCTTGEEEEFFDNGVLVTLASLRRTNPELPVVVFYDHLSDRQLDALAGCDLRRVDPTPFRATHRADLTRATFFPFYIGKELGDVPRVLYLDTDLVVLDSLEEAFDHGHPLAAVPKTVAHPSGEFRDPDAVAAMEGLEELCPVFNAGVVCFDGRFWRRHGLLDLALDIARRHGWETFYHCDQGILNLIATTLCGHHQLGTHLNFRPVDAPRARLAKNRRGLVAPLADNRPATVVHWTGPRKPWHSRPNLLQRRFPRLMRITSDASYHQFRERGV